MTTSMNEQQQRPLALSYLRFSSAQQVKDIKKADQINRRSSGQRRTATSSLRHPSAILGFQLTRATTAPLATSGGFSRQLRTA